MGMGMSGVTLTVILYLMTVNVVKGQDFMMEDVFYNVSSYASTDYNITTKFTEASLFFNGSLISRLICRYSYPFNTFIYQVSDVTCLFNRSTLTFVITRINASYAGNYTLTTDNSSTGIGTVFVMDKPTTPTLAPLGLAVENNNVNVRANALSTSSPSSQPFTYTWLVNGSPSFPDFRFQANNDFLTIRNLSRRDSSFSIQCYVTERNGFRSDTGNISLNVLYKPEIYLTPSALVTVKGQSGVTISCQITDGNPRTNITYRWSKNGSNVSGQSKYNFGAIRKEDAGTYSCTASNTAGLSDPINMTLTVQYPPEVICSYNVTEEEGNTVTLRCNVSANPSASYTWRKEGSSSVISSAATITFNSIGRFQAGNYSFTANNTLRPTGEAPNITSIQKSVFVDVQYGPGSYIQVSRSSVSIVENKSISEIVCNATCNPPCEMSWSGPNTNINNGVLSLGIAHRNKSGIYNCTATTRILNKYDRSSTKFVVVNVYYPASINTLAISGGNVQTQGSKIKITCTTAAYPTPSVTLYKDGQSIVSQNSSISSYNIATATCLNSGNYTCNARNAYNSVSDTESTFLRIKCTPKLYQDNAVQTITITSWSGQQLSATFLAYPQPQIVWYHVTSNNKNTSVTENITMDVKADSIFTAKLTNSFSEEEDFGMYYVEARNSAGSSVARKSFNTIPRRRPNAPSDLNVNCKPSGIANVTWISSFNGGIQQFFRVLFKKSTDKIFTRQGQTFVDKGKNQLHFFNVINLEIGVDYLFRIEAENTAGATQTSSVPCRISGETSTPKSSTGGIFAAGFGSAIGVIILVGVGIFVFIKVRRGDCTQIFTRGNSNSKEKTYDSLDKKDQNEKPYDVLGKTNQGYSDESTHIYQNHPASKTEVKKHQTKGAKPKAKKKCKGAEKIDGHIYQNADIISGKETTENVQHVQATESKPSADHNDKKIDEKHSTPSKDINNKTSQPSQASLMMEMKERQENLKKKGAKQKDEKKVVRKGTYENTAFGSKK